MKRTTDGVAGFGITMPAWLPKLNAACMARGKMRIALGQFKVAHAEGTQILFDNWPGFGSEVVAYGPGR